MNILVVGNGFDLAHDLPTGYQDFLGFCRMLKGVYSVNKSANADDVWNELEIKLKSISNTERLKLKFLELYSISIVESRGDEKIFIRTNTVFDELYDEIDNNVWVEFFLRNPMYRKENWIDFESEISRVVQIIDNDMKKTNSKECTIVRKIGESYFSEYFLDDIEARTQARDEEGYKSILGKTMSIGDVSKYMDGYREKNPVEPKKGLITYKELIENLERSLNKLIRALEIYLCEYVEKIECNVKSPDVKKLCFDAILSFNYTNTYERLYDVGKLLQYDYIHGEANIQNSTDTNNMVLGIDEYLLEDRKNTDIEFIAFKKFYQRIHKGTGCKYKDWVDVIRSDKDIMNLKNVYIDENGEMVYERENAEYHNLYIFGHSLDVTDKDVLRDLILNEKVHTTIFCFNKHVMGQQIANLVKVLGQDELIKRTGGSSKTIEFKLQEDMIRV